MVLLTDKPNHVIPSRPGTTQVNSNKDEIFGNHFTEDPVGISFYSFVSFKLKINNLEEAFSNEKLEKTLKLITLVPKQKYQMPQTSNQEIGWFSNQLVFIFKISHNGKIKKKTIAPSKWNHKLRSNEITKFANDYFEMTKTNPFTLK